MPESGILNRIGTGSNKNTENETALGNPPTHLHAPGRSQYNGCPVEPCIMAFARECRGTLAMNLVMVKLQTATADRSA
jgi:hypothetical protein